MGQAGSFENNKSEITNSGLEYSLQAVLISAG
jgi:hypothetical protein